ncbi:MAG: hypothetical protein AAF961_15585, partial [Planctomycetota bacterium]
MLTHGRIFIGAHACLMLACLMLACLMLAAPSLSQFCRAEENSDANAAQYANPWTPPDGASADELITFIEQLIEQE